MKIIDAHTHIFPDKIALRASGNIGAFYGIPMYTDAMVSTLKKEGKTNARRIPNIMNGIRNNRHATGKDTTKKFKNRKIIANSLTKVGLFFIFIMYLIIRFSKKTKKVLFFS